MGREWTARDEQSGSGGSREEAYSEMAVNFNLSIRRADEDMFGGFKKFLELGVWLAVDNGTESKLALEFNLRN